MRQTTLITLLHHRRAKVDTGLFSTPTMQRVLRSKSQSEGRAISTALSYTRFVHCTLTPKTTGEASHSVGHISYLQACASRGTAPREREKHYSSFKGEVLEQAGQTLRPPAGAFPIRSPRPILSARASRSHSDGSSSGRGAGPGAGSIPQEQPAGLSLLSPVPRQQLPAGHRGPWLWQSCSSTP